MRKVTSTKGLYNTHGVYGFKNTESNKWYFGSSIATKGGCQGIGGRLRRHLWELKKECHHNSHFQNSWNKHGEKAFEMYVVEECDKEVAREREKEWIEKHKNDVYNICTETEHPGGLPWTEERRRKQSGKNHFMYGKNHTEETKEMISKNRKGLTAGEDHHLYGVGHTDESRKKMSESHKLLIGEKNPFFGKKHSEETKKINSEKKKQWIAENGHPRVSLPPKGKYKGVYKSGRKWIAMIRIDSKLKSLGTFKEAEDAARNYDYHAKKHYPPTAYINFPEFDYKNFEPKKDLV